MKHYKIVGLAAALLLVISCFLPWAYYTDIDKHFTGFFTYQNMYGKPAKAFIFLAVVSLVLIYVNKIWAKRTLLFLSAVTIAYTIKTFVLFTSCYSGVCPQKEYGLYLLIISVVGLVVASVFPDIKLIEKEGE
ncbi:MAG: hypothetical protein ABI266_09130 [Ginsengibacter sp.]